MWRSCLFVPVLNDRLVQGAARRGADMITLDLEAAVPADRKDEARVALVDAAQRLKEDGAVVAVRINDPESCGAADIDAALVAGAEAIVLPMASPDTVAWAAGRAGAGASLIPLVEDPNGVIDARDIANAAPSVIALGFGVEDYANAMGAPPTSTLLEPAAVQVIQAARACKKAPLVLPDTIADFRDIARFENAAQRARALGSAGGFAIHPDQVAVLNRSFAPTQAEVVQAQQVIDAAEAARQQGLAVARLGGLMIDAPVEARAKAILAQSLR